MASEDKDDEKGRRQVYTEFGGERRKKADCPTPGIKREKVMGYFSERTRPGVPRRWLAFSGVSCV